MESPLKSATSRFRTALALLSALGTAAAVIGASGPATTVQAAAPECSYRFTTFADLAKRNGLSLSRVLDLNVGQFATSSEAATLLFEAANKLKGEMRGLGESVVEELRNFGSGTPKLALELKRENVNHFWTSVVQKMYRKKYESVRQMPDLARGRIDVNGGDDVGMAVKMIQKLASTRGFQVDVESPRRPIAGKPGFFGYPRYHIILKNTDGIQFEWQVGTRATSHVWEMPGIPIPKGLRLPAGTRSDIHDIEYRIFQPIWKKASLPNAEPGLVALERDLALRKFSEEVDLLAAESALRGDQTPDLSRRVAALHRRAGEILNELVNRKGNSYVETMLNSDE